MLRVGKFISYEYRVKNDKPHFVLKFLDNIGLQDIYLYLNSRGTNTFLDTILSITGSKNLDEVINKGICLAFRKEWKELDSENIVYNLSLKAIFDVSYQSLREVRQGKNATDYKSLNLNEVFITNSGEVKDLERWKKDNAKHDGLQTARSYTHPAFRE